MEIRITHIDTACILLEINGFKIVTDPTLDFAGKYYHHGFGAVSRKTENPALPVTTLHGTDLVLLSHHQHNDNLDRAGKAFLASVPLILSTKQAAKAIKGITGLDSWESYKIETAKVPGLVITATPAQHRPSWLPEFFSGKVTGFIIRYQGQKGGAIYISGDTVYFKGIEKVAERFEIGTAIMHVGDVQFRYLSGFGKYTMDSTDLIKAAKVLKPKKIIPVHHKGWSHFKETEQHLRDKLTASEFTKDIALFLESGKTVDIG